MIAVERLRKLFGTTVAVEDVSFTAPAGGVFGLLGLNGAGKSTTIGCIAGLLTPTSGRVSVTGERQSPGVVPQEIAVYEDLSAEENLNYWGGAQRLRGRVLRGRVAHALEVTGLSERSREPVAQFSGGMKRRLNLACGIVHQPSVLLLDEPTVGVDAQSRARLLDVIRTMARNGACVLYTTHYMEEAEGLCDRMAIVDGGRVVAEGTLAELRGLAGESDLLRFGGMFRPDGVREALGGAGFEVLQADEAAVTVAVTDAPAKLSAVLPLLAAAGAEVRTTTICQPNLESLFFKLTGKALRE